MSDNNFNCQNCQSSDLEKDEVETLKCGHIICWDCLTNYIDSNLDSKIYCPIKNCRVSINDSVIRKALPNNKIADYESLCIGKLEQHFKCLLNGCDNVVFYTNKETQFECSICSMFNCISCQATHPYVSCKDYQKLKISALTNAKNKEQLETMNKTEQDNARAKLLERRRESTLSMCKELESQGILPNDQTFTCVNCSKIIPKGLGVQLRNCYHMFCKNCLNESIKISNNIPVKCLNFGCNCDIQDREVREILNEQEYDMYNDKCLALAKSSFKNAFHCKTPDCKYFAICDPGLKSFVCPICQSQNCIKCIAIHKKFETCKQYLLSKEKSSMDKRTRQYIEDQIKLGKCMKCTGCGCLLEKVSGCNWVQCSSCKLELCWVLKIPRWGPKGRNDNSGGCKCGVNGQPCDPACTLTCDPH